jgi:uncharacterized delta-60 repeat protein
LACLAVAAVIPTVLLTQSRKSASPHLSLISTGVADSTYARTGTVLVPGSNGASGVTVVPAGLPAAGDAVVSGGDGTHFQVGRFTAGGQLDTSFGHGLTNYFLGQANAVAVIPPGLPNAGDVVAAGYRTGSTCGSQFPTPVVAEYTSGGLLNTAFGSGGIAAITPCPTGGAQLTGVAVDPAGNIDVAGAAFGTSNAASTLAASVTKSGSTAWSTSTVVGTPISSQAPTASQANAVAVSAVTGDVVTAGYSLIGGQKYLTVAAFKNGALDPAFNETGFVTTTNRPTSSAAGVVVLPNGNIVVAGSATARFLLAQYTKTGSVDSAFGSSGQAYNSPNLNATDALTGIAYQPYGNTLSAVGLLVTGAPVRDMVTVQYNAASGAPNLQFGSVGAVVHKFAFDSALSAVAVQSDGKTVAAGAAPIVNAVQGLAVTRVTGPALSVGNLALVQVSSFSPITVRFTAAINEPLYSSVPAEFCASSGAVIVGQGRCGIVTIPAGVGRILVTVRIPITTGPGQSQTASLTAESIHGLSASTTQRTGYVTIQHLASPQPYKGYRLVASDGGIFTFGKAPYLGSTGAVHLAKPIVGMAVVPHGVGYWLVASDGGIFTFGAPYFGSTGAVHLAKPIVGMSSTPDGRGYWLVASDGGIFTFGDAGYFGSTGAVHLAKPIVGMSSTPDGRGYWLVASDGGIFTFGDAGYFGSTGGIHLAKPIVGMATYPGAPGYWMVASDGGIFSFGAAGYHGSTGAIRLAKPIVGMTATSDGKGYYLVASDGGIFTFGDAHYYGSTGAIHLNKPIVGMSG